MSTFPPKVAVNLEGNDAFVINNENDVTTFPPNEMEAATKQTPEVVFFFQINLLEMATPHFPKWKLELVYLGREVSWKGSESC